MSEPRFRVGDRVDYNNSSKPDTVKPNGTPGTVKRVIIKRVYLIAWDDDKFREDFDDTAPYSAEELVRLEVQS